MFFSRLRLDFIRVSPALGRQRQDDIDFEVSLTYKVNSGTTKAAQRDLFSNEAEQDRSELS